MVVIVVVADVAVAAVGTGHNSVHIFFNFFLRVFSLVRFGSCCISLHSLNGQQKRKYDIVFKSQ